MAHRLGHSAFLLAAEALLRFWPGHDNCNAHAVCLISEKCKWHAEL